MITPNTKWEYKVVNVQVTRTPSEPELLTAAKVADILNKSGQSDWELISTIHQTDNILPEGFVIMKRLYQAPVLAPRRFGVSAKKKT